jgi:predicted nucleic acid-binding protein
LNAYADTSFLISLYVQDHNSAAADSLVRRHRPTFLLTPFGELEFSNAVELRVFRRELTKAEARSVRDEFLSHLGAGVFQLEELDRAAWQTALRLSRRHTSRLGGRTLDVLHVATALVLKPDAFCTFDERQRRLARAERLRVLPG